MQNFEMEVQETAQKVNHAALKKPKHKNDTQSAVVWVLGDIVKKQIYRLKTNFSNI